MADNVHELINKKMQEAGVKVTDRPVYVTPDCYGSRYGQLFIPGAEVTVGEFTVIGLAYLSDDLAKQIRMPEKTDPQVWLPHCLMGVIGMNTYVLVGLVKNRIFEVEVVHAENLPKALIALDFGPCDAWEDHAVAMNECGLMSDDRLEELRQGPDNDELKDEVAEFAAEHWGPDDYYILEIKPDGSVTVLPEMVTRAAVM